MSVTTAPPTDRGDPPPDSPPSPPARWPRRWLIVAGVLAVAVAVVVTVVVVVSRRHHHRPPVAAAPPTSGPAQQRKLVSAAQVTGRMTLHATYRALGDPAKLGGPLTYEVWQRPPDGREDRNGALAERCHEDGKGAWTCQAVVVPTGPVGSGVPGPLDLLAAINSYAPSPSAREAVTTSGDFIGNQKVTCYQLVAPGETYVLCVADNGTPELIANTKVRYELITASSNVPASVFTH